MSDVVVLLGPDADLSRPGLLAPAPHTVGQLAALCSRWGAEVGIAVETVACGTAQDVADALQRAVPAAWGVVVSGADLDASAVADRAIVRVAPRRARTRVPGVRLIHGRGVDGFRWALHHLAWTRAWQPRTLSYGEDADHVGDLRVPDGDGPHPVAVLLHGGFWLQPWERDVMDGVAVDLARRGVATWNLEYRRVGAGGGWPQTGEDVLAGIAHVQRLGVDHGLDPARLVVVGHSAGAQLALWAAVNTDVRPRLAVALAGVLDLAAGIDEGLGGGVVESFLAGASPHVASPSALLPLGVEQLLVHAGDDRLVPVSHTRRYAAAAAAAGDGVMCRQPEGGGHFDLIDPRSAAWRHTAEAIVAALS